MPPVSPLTIGLSDFLSQQRAPAATGALQGGAEGVKILQSLIAANSRQNLQTDPYALAVFQDYLRTRSEGARDVRELTQAKNEAVTRGADGVAAAFAAGQVKGYDLTQGKDIVAFLQAASAKVGKNATAQAIMEDIGTRYPEVAQRMRSVDPEQWGIVKDFLRKAPGGTTLVGQKPLGLNDLFPKPGATAAQAVSPAVPANQKKNPLGLKLP